MAKTTGMAWTTFSIGGSDIKNDTTSLDIAQPRETQDVTGLDKSAIERLLLYADGSVDAKGVFNAALSHAALKTVSTASAGVVVVCAAATVSLTMTMMQTDYKVSRGDDGSLGWAAPFVLSSGTAPAWA